MSYHNQISSLSAEMILNSAKDLPLFAAADEIINLEVGRAWLYVDVRGKIHLTQGQRLTAQASSTVALVEAASAAERAVLTKAGLDLKLCRVIVLRRKWQVSVSAGNPEELLAFGEAAVIGISR